MAYRVIDKREVPARGHWQEGGAEDIFYEVSYGEEDWERGPMRVFRIRMKYQGGIDRWPATFPTKSDWEAVKISMDELMESHPP